MPKPCNRCNPQGLSPGNKKFDPPYNGGFYERGSKGDKPNICSNCGAEEGRKVKSY